MTKRRFRTPGEQCSVVDCQAEARVRGWCQRHYERWLKHGDPLANFQIVNTAEQFWARTRPDGACIIWTKGLNQGYGRLRWKGRVMGAHQVAFFLRLGRWPEGELRHLCNRRECVLHAVEGTRAENMQDKIAAGTAWNMRKDFCLRGHPYDEANSYFNPAGYRKGCRACMRLRQSRLRDRRRAMRAPSTSDLL